MTWLIVILGLLALAAVVPHVLELRRGLPDPRGATGQLLALSGGNTHAVWYGPARGPVAVLVHGLTTPLPVWDKVAQGLVSLGYRVLAYDLYGRGYSDNPAGPQNRAHFMAQLEDLLAHEKLAEDVTLVGYSMGGAIVTAYAATHTEQVKRVVLIAPAGITPPNEEWLARIAREKPVLGDWLNATFGARFLRRRIAAQSHDATEVPGIIEVQLAELDRRGFLSAVLSSRRGILAEVQEAEHRALGLADVPVYAIWAEDDLVIPIRGMGTLSAWNRAARQESVAGAGHGLPHTHGSAVTARLRDMLRED